MLGTPVLETPRLILRQPMIKDIPPFGDFYADPEATRHLGGVRSREDAFTHFRASTSAWRRNGYDLFTIVNKATGEWMGRAGPTWPKGWPGGEVAWSLAVKWWGAGYATEAAIACIDYAFDSLGWDEVIHTIAPNNIASQGLARRVGAINRGPIMLPPPNTDHVKEIWSQGREAWSENRRRLDAAVERV